VRVLIVSLAALALFGCASPDFETPGLAPAGPIKSGMREALQQQLDSPNCADRAHRDATRLASAAGISATDVAFVTVAGSARYAQLDDPTRDWTRDQAAGASTQCPPKGKKHRYFA
jgi:hypothetical protein